MSDDELAGIFSGDVEPALSDDDWTGAAIAAADGLRAELGGGEGGGGGAGWLLAAGGVAVVGGGGYALFRLSKRRKAAPAPGEGEAVPALPFDGLTDEELSQRGSALLVEIDDAVKTSEQELDFAEAEFGRDEVTPFHEALTNAKAELQAAFAARGGLDSEELPDVERRALLVEVVERTERADAVLDAQAEAFAELRDRAARAPELLAALAPKIDDAAARLPGAESALAELKGRYPVAALGDVADNDVEARDRVEFARAALDEGNDAVAAGNHNDAALATRAIEEALQQVDTLVVAIERAGAELERARAALPARLDSLRRDIAEADAAGGSADVAGAASAARQVLQAIESRTSDPELDPVASMARLTDAEAHLDEALAPLRSERERLERARALLADALTRAETRVSAVQDFITTRRGAVGSGRPDPHRRGGPVGAARGGRSPTPTQSRRWRWQNRRSRLPTRRRSSPRQTWPTTARLPQRRGRRRRHQLGRHGPRRDPARLGPARPPRRRLPRRRGVGGFGGGFGGGSGGGGARPGGFGGSGARRGGGGRF